MISPTPARSQITRQCPRTCGACDATVYFPHPQCTGECQAGYFCPTGSVSPTQRECGGEDVYCPTGSGAPIPIPTGYYSTGGDVRTRSGKSECREQDSAYLPQCPSTTIKSS